MEGLALWIASDSISNCSEERGVSYGLISRQADSDDDTKLVHSIAEKITTIFGDDFKTLLFAVSWGFDSPQSATVTAIGSQAVALDATITPLLHEKFGARLSTLPESTTSSRVAPHSFKLSNWDAADDEPVLLHILDESIITASDLAQSQSSVPRPTPPPGALSINQILDRQRGLLKRLTPEQAHTAYTTRTPSSSSSTPSTPFSVLVDIRPAAQRATEGSIPSALIIERNVLEWRLDPQNYARLTEPAGITDNYDNEVIVFCSEGYTSSLAAAALKELGLSRATDVVGGFKAWKAAGYPTTGGD